MLTRREASRLSSTTAGCSCRALGLDVLAWHLPGADGPGQFPALLQQPRRRPAHDDRIIAFAHRPHHVSAVHLLPIRKRDRTREWIHQPRARQSRLILAVLPPIV